MGLQDSTGSRDLHLIVLLLDLVVQNGALLALRPHLFSDLSARMASWLSCKYAGIPFVVPPLAIQIAAT